MTGKKSYAVMVRSAIAALKDHEGSSRAAIAKYIASEFGADNANALKKALKRGVAAEGNLEHGNSKARYKKGRFLCQTR